MALTPQRILEVGMGFWPAKVLLSAVELGVFSSLGASSKTPEELRALLGLHPRAVPDFPDALVALGFLERDGDGPTACYRNTRRALPSSIGGVPATWGGSSRWRTPGSTPSGVS